MRLLIGPRHEDVRADWLVFPIGVDRRNPAARILIQTLRTQLLPIAQDSLL